MFRINSGTEKPASCDGSTLAGQREIFFHKGLGLRVQDTKRKRGSIPQHAYGCCEWQHAFATDYQPCTLNRKFNTRR